MHPVVSAVVVVVVLALVGWWIALLVTNAQARAQGDGVQPAPPKPSPSRGVRPLDAPLPVAVRLTITGDSPARTFATAFLTDAQGATVDTTPETTQDAVLVMRFGVTSIARVFVLLDTTTVPLTIQLWGADGKSVWTDTIIPGTVSQFDVRLGWHPDVVPEVHFSARSSVSFVNTAAKSPPVWVPLRARWGPATFAPSLPHSLVPQAGEKVKFSPGAAVCPPGASLRTALREPFGRPIIVALTMWGDLETARPLLVVPNLFRIDVEPPGNLVVRCLDNRLVHKIHLSSRRKDPDVRLVFAVLCTLQPQLEILIAYNGRGHQSTITGTQIAAVRESTLILGADGTQLADVQGMPTVAYQDLRMLPVGKGLNADTLLALVAQVQRELRF